MDKRKESSTNTIYREPVQADEIDLLAVFGLLSKKRKLLATAVVAGFFVGLFIAFASKIEYEAGSKLMPEMEDGIQPNLNGLGSLAGLAGINLSTLSSGAMSPEIYPEIVQSLPFQLEVLRSPVYFEKLDTVMTPYHYLLDVDRPSLLRSLFLYTIGLPIQLKKWFSESDSNPAPGRQGRLIRLSVKEKMLIERFQKRISVTVDSKTGVIALYIEMPDPLAAAQTTENAVATLRKFIVDYNLEKARDNLGFIEDMYNEKKHEFETAQRELALFTDRNRNVTTATARIEEERLRNEYNLAFEVYTGIAKQLEQARIKVKENTPVFTVLEPVAVPVEKSSPKRLLILAVSTLLGGIAGVLLIGIQQVYARLKIRDL